MFRIFKKWTCVSLVSFLLLISGTISNAQIIDIEPSLQKNIQEALANSPDLNSWSMRVEAADRKISQAGAWNDPMFSIGMLNIPVNSFDLNQEAMTGAWITLSQSIPLTSQYSIKSDIASLSKERAISNLKSQKFNIALHISEVWYDWAFLRASESTLDSTIEVFDEFLKIASKKYETGSGLQQDLFRIGTERSKMKERRLVLKQVAKTTGERVAILMGRDPLDTPLPPELIPDQFNSMEGLNLDSLLIVDNPLLKSIRTLSDISNRQVNLKQSLWWPNLKLNAGYGFRQNSDTGMNRPDFFSISAGISIPIFGSSKQGAAVEEARAISKQAQFEYRNSEFQQRFKLQALLDQDLSLEQQIDIYRNEVIPQAISTLSATMTTYSVGKADIEALLMAEMALYNSQLELLDRIKNRSKTRANIAAIVASSDLIHTDD